MRRSLPPTLRDLATNELGIYILCIVNVGTWGQL